MLPLQLIEDTCFLASGNQQKYCDKMMFSLNLTTLSLNLLVYQIWVNMLFLSTISVEIEIEIVNFNKKLYWWLPEKGVRYNDIKFSILLRNTNSHKKT
jgi:hypothetical protein